jgi:hypothetical protein
VEPRPESIRIGRLSSRPFVAGRIATSLSGDQATIGIEMSCKRASTIPMFRIASPREISAANNLGVLFTNPKRHGDDGKRFLVMSLSLGNRDYLGFNADLVDSKNKRVNGGVGTRVGDSGGPLVVYDQDNVPLFAGVNSFGVFKGGDPESDPNLYAQQGGIANGGQTQTVALINKARELGRPGVFTAAQAPAPATHKASDSSL